jgi:hypothetical protein
MENLKLLACPNVLVVLLMLCLLPEQAKAQYFQSVEPGYTLAEVSPEEALGLSPTLPSYAEAEAVSGLKLDALFEVRGGMRRYFAMEWGAEDEGQHLVEYEIVPDSEPAQPAAAASYKFDGGGVFVGWGHDPSEDWSPAEVVSFFIGPDGSVQELARWECGATYCPGVYALDLTNSGGVDLVVPWATGAGGGGGVELFAIVPTGGFSAWGEELESGSFWSSNGATELNDVDGDGDWELAAYFPLLFSAAGYYYTELSTFDPDSYSWVDARAIAPQLYEQEENFYRALAAEVREFIKHPEDYRVDDEDAWVTYGCYIEGELYSLDPFTSDDQGTPDYTWIDTLLDFADGFGEPGS